MRVSAASVNSSSPASMHSHVSNGPPSSLLAALGQADSLLASYRQSLSLPNSAASSVVIDDTTGTPSRGNAASGVSTKHTSMKAGIDRGVGSFPAYAASVTASAESARTALEVLITHQARARVTSISRKREASLEEFIRPSNCIQTRTAAT